MIIIILLYYAYISMDLKSQRLINFQQFTQTFSVCRNMKNRFGFAFLGQHFMHDSTTHFIDDHRAQTLR